MISLIAAMASNRVIGKAGQLPWKKLRTDTAWFQSKTMGHPVVMGRKTYDSLPEQWKPLPGRDNIVITRDASSVDHGAIVAGSLEEALEQSRGLAGNEEVFVIGGGQIYEQALPCADRIYLTVIDTDCEGDTRFPELSETEWSREEVGSFEQDERNDFSGTFYVYVRKTA